MTRADDSSFAISASGAKGLTRRPAAMVRCRVPFNTVTSVSVEIDDPAVAPWRHNGFRITPVFDAPMTPD